MIRGNRTRNVMTVIIVITLTTLLFADPITSGAAKEINKSLSLASANPHPVWKLYQTDQARRGMAAVYDSHRQVIVMFGGFDSQDIENNETWKFDGTSW